MESELKLVYLNSSGLSGTKLHDGLEPLVLRSEICCFSETWLGAETAQKLKIEGYTCYTTAGKKQTRKGRRSGGMSVYIKNTITANISRAILSSPVDWYILQLDWYQLVIGFIYNPPISSNFSNSEVFEEMKTDVEEWKERGIDNIIIIGDLNSRVGAVSDQVFEGKVYDHINEPIPEFFERNPEVPDRVNRDLVVNQNGLKLIDFLKEVSMIIVNGRKAGDEQGQFTYLSERGSSAIDLCLTSYQTYFQINSFRVEYGLYDSNHCPISLQIDIPSLPRNYRGTAAEDQETPKEEAIKIRKYRWEEEKGLKYATGFANIYRFVFILCNMFIRSGNISRCVDSLSNFILHAANHMMVKQKGLYESIHRPKWFNQACKQAKHMWRKAANKLRKNKSDENITHFKNTRTEYRKAKREAKKDYTEKEKQELLSLRSEGKSKDLWMKIRKYVKPFKNASDKITNSMWKEHFDKMLNVNREVGRPEWEDAHPMQEEVNPTLDAEITSFEVQMAIKGLKRGKSAGVDGICSEMLFSISGLIQAILATLFTKILQLGEYPCQWTKSIIVPLYKNKGNRGSPGSYRGISLLPLLGKVFTRICNNRLTSWLNENKIIHENQAGFRKGYSTTDQIFILNTLITQQLNKKGGKLYVCLVDMRRAFDAVHRKALWFKLYKIGIRGHFLNVLMSMYSTCVFTVRIATDMITTPIKTTCGVFQGCSLSPTLFQVFLNDIVDYMDELSMQFDAPKLASQPVNILLFADDISLISTTPEGLQRQLQRLEKYVTHWKLEINTDKTNILVFRQGGRLSNREIWYYRGSRMWF